MRKEQDTRQTVVNEATTALTNAQKKVDEITGKIASLQRQVEENTQSGTDALQEIQAMEGYEAWQFDDLPDISASITELQEGNKQYNALTEAVKNEKNALSITQDMLKRMDSMLEKLRTEIPSLRDVTAAETGFTENLENDTSMLMTNAQILQRMLTQTHQALQEAEKSVAEFLGSHPDISAERLTELARTPRTVIDEIRDSTRLLNEDFAKAKTALQTFVEQRRALEEEKPELSEGVTIEALSTQIAEQKEVLTEKNRDLGARIQKLADDDKNRVRFAARQAEKEALDRVAEKWKALSAKLGDKDGKIFRKIAQSLVLGDILTSASEYLSYFTQGRYRLTSRPGTLDIELVDSREGDAHRHVDTASGGETFLVSLSLALALGAVGHGLAVDILFIDEGFGSLSGEPLNNVLGKLKSLRRNRGCRVGIISHIESLRELIEHKILVTPIAATDASTITTV